MTITVPNAPADLNAGDLQTKENIVGESGSETDWTDIVEATNWNYANAGVQICGRRWDFLTTNTSYTTVNDTTNGADLDQWTPGARLTRAKGNGDYGIRLAYFGDEVDVEWTLVRRNSDGTRDQVAQVTFEQTNSSPQWAGTTVTLTEDDVSDGGLGSNRAVRIEHNLRAQMVADAANASIQQTAAWALVLSGSQLPTA